MYTQGRLIFLYSESLIHAGAGEGVGAIDLPVQREKVTNWPIIWAQSLKGAMRDHFEGKGCPTDDLFVVFGPDSEKTDSQGRKGDPSQNAGAVTFSDARVLLFPVWSLKGTFAYVTCPLALKRLYRDLQALGRSGHSLTDIDMAEAVQISVQGEDSIVLHPDHDSFLTIALNTGSHPSEKLALGEMSFDVTTDEKVKKLSNWLLARWPTAPWFQLTQRLAVVHDDVFGYLVEHETEVMARNCIDDETGTVKTGALWNEECLPRETLLYATVLATDPLKTGLSGLETADKILNYVVANPPPISASPEYLWLGGDQTVGRGILHTTFA